MTTNGLLTSPGGNPASVTVSIGGLWGDSLPGGAGWDGSSAVYPGMVCFNGGNAVQNVTLAAGPTNPAITAYFNGQFTTFNEFSTACTLSYTKIGAGAEVFTQDNSQGGLLNGTNNVNAGILELDNASGSGLPNGPVTINSGGQLQGCGAVGGGVGDFNVNNGGVLAAGTNGETAGNVFTVYGNGTLYLNGTLAVNLWSGAGTGGGDGAPSSDMLLLDLPVVLGSASSLVVGNLNHMGDYAPLDTWTIIDWGFGTPTGIFGSVTLPALPEYMAWDTNDLYTMGQIFVVYAWDAPPPSPATNITYSPANNGTVTITGVNGNGSYSTTLELLSTTQLWQPLTNWTDAATGGYTNGVFTFTVTNVHATPSTYFTTKAMP